MAKVSLTYIRIFLAVILIFIISSKIYATVQSKYMDKSAVSIEKEDNEGEKKSCDEDDCPKVKILKEELFYHSYSDSIQLITIELIKVYSDHVYTFFLNHHIVVLTPPPDVA